MTETDVKNAIEMQKNGKTTAEIAQTFNVSRQTISKYLNKPLNGNYVMRLDFMFRQKVCTEIYVNFADKKMKIRIGTILNSFLKKDVFRNQGHSEKLF